jgi:hypothetical protein
MFKLYHTPLSRINAIFFPNREMRGNSPMSDFCTFFTPFAVEARAFLRLNFKLQKHLEKVLLF